MTAPKRISISPTYNQKRDDDYYLVDRDAFPGKGTEYIRADIAKAAIAAAYEALRWYEEQARGCRLIHSGGDKHRQALNDDGGKRARAILDQIEEDTDK